MRESVARPDDEGIEQIPGVEHAGKALLALSGRFGRRRCRDCRLRRGNRLCFFFQHKLHLNLHTQCFVHGLADQLRISGFQPLPSKVIGGGNDEQPVREDARLRRLEPRVEAGLAHTILDGGEHLLPQVVDMTIHYKIHSFKKSKAATS
ncbi:hypothetical protein D3C73_1255900 [compost metagenome]